VYKIILNVTYHTPLPCQIKETDAHSHYTDDKMHEAVCMHVGEGMRLTRLTVIALARNLLQINNVVFVCMHNRIQMR